MGERIYSGKLKKAIALLAAVFILALAANKLALEAQNAVMTADADDAGYFQGVLSEGMSKGVISQPRLSCQYYVDKDFKRSLKAAVPVVRDGRQLIGGIVPHHLLADSLISSFFTSISAAEPELVFIVGPNHKRAGSKKVITGHWDWQTPYGLLEADDAAVESLVEGCQAGEDFDLLEVEHSVSSLVPYVKYYMPEARLVPVILHGNLGIEGSKDLALKISEAAGSRKWIIIGSIDFSHYLPPDAADKMDKITLEAIKSGDFKGISRMDNDNLDSPPSLMTTLEIMRNKGEYEMKVTGHSNSAEVSGIYSESTTSYFTILFYEK